MGKKLVAAGMVAVALAVVPVLGAFASEIDTVSVTVSASCTLARENYASGGVTNNQSHKNGADGAWSTTAGDNTLNTTRTNGTVTTSLGTSQFKVVCNNNAGYKVTVGTTSLSVSGGSQTPIPNNTTYSATVSGWSPIVETVKKVNNDTVKTESTTTAGTIFEVGYGVGISATQAAGTYTGTATYTLATL